MGSENNTPKALSGPAGEGELCAVMDSESGGASLNALRRMARAILAKYEVTPRPS